MKLKLSTIFSMVSSTCYVIAKKASLRIQAWKSLKSKFALSDTSRIKFQSNQYLSSTISLILYNQKGVKMEKNSIAIESIY
jgi:hypothetical protein